MRKVFIFLGMIVAIIAMIIISCKKDFRKPENLSDNPLKTRPDTSYWTEIGYIDANDIPVLSYSMS